MDVGYFLSERTDFIRYFYRESSRPFFEIKRKIDANEEPYISPYQDDGGEPYFLPDWLRADEALNILGRNCISMLSESLKLFFKTWEFQFWRDEPVCFRNSGKTFKEKGFVAGYRECFGSALGVDWTACPANFSILEQIVLARNDDQHAGHITSMYVNHGKKTQGKYPQLLFVRDNEEREIAAKVLDDSKWWDPTLHVSEEGLFAALSEVEKLAEWLNDELMERRYG